MSVQSPFMPNREQKTHPITQADLPLSCPMSHTPLWDLHPRIYLPIEKTGYISCPYCNAAYSLE